MTREPDAILVGSGPAGVSAAFPLLRAGMRVLLVDGGVERDVREVPAGSYHEIRRGRPDQWIDFLGRGLEALRPEGPPSPKFDAPGSRFAYSGFDAANRVMGDRFAVVGSIARGGLSNIWGAGVSTWGRDELAEFPLGPRELEPHVLRVAERIGVVGFEEDDLAGELDGAIPSLPSMRLSENARRLLDRYRSRRVSVRAAGVRLGAARAAVLTRSRAGREACRLCDLCVWGCRHGSIYSAAHDLQALTADPGLEYRPGALVEKISRDGESFRVELREGARRSSLRSGRLILAAGALATTRLVLELGDRFDQPVPVLGAPGFGFALFLPGRLGAPLATEEYSMGQLSFATSGDPQRPADDGYGTLFPASGVPGSLIIEHMPLTRPGAIRLFRYLQPALLLGNCFLPGRYSRNAATLERLPDGGSRLVVRGGVADDLGRRIDRTRRQLSAAFRKLGAILIPSSVKPLGPGEEVRHAGTVPMRANPGPGECDVAGELHGCRGLHLVDLSVFPSMAAKHHTLTLMANADRIGEAIASRWRQDRGGISRD